VIVADPLSVTIVGAGLSGSLMALYLARGEHRVDVYERRSSSREGRGDQGRSINLGVSARGIRALRQVGLLDAVLQRSVPMRGRMVHRRDGTLSFHPYGTAAHEVLHSILRNDLNGLLVDAASTLPNVRYRFDQRLSVVDKHNGVATFVDERDATEVNVRSDLVIGADGAFSAVRDQLTHGTRVDYSQVHLDWGYKELTIPATPGRTRRELEALHVWPGEHGLMVAHPNRDGSLTGTVFLPLDGRYGFAALDTPSAVRRFFAAEFPDTTRLMPDLVDEFGSHPVGGMVTIQTSAWRHEDRVVLIGDACHAVYPFYGQGMNAAFEDCSTLSACLAQRPHDRAGALAEYQRRRKPHTDVLAELAKRNLVELRDRLRSPWFVARRKADLVLNRLFPRTWLPLYTMVSHTTMPYADALARAQRQDRLLALAGGAVASTAVAAAIGRGRRC
jgi:kynurenine 3-monooxygenase